MDNFFTSIPQIILSYNETKGEVDTLDHLIANFTCCGKTPRWTTNAFYFILDVAVYNGFVLFSMKNAQQVASNRHRQRRLSIQKWAAQLM